MRKIHTILSIVLLFLYSIPGKCEDVNGLISDKVISGKNRLLLPM
jgi:hypothetical protein